MIRLRRSSLWMLGWAVKIALVFAWLCVAVRSVMA